ncbi:VTT domain-containing protein [Geodermatophilus sp. URMC 61]|uniref:VTT domain-containing protein n=1 Tax=Geodermatophilus sp. URMC 61 TaxID=3423411 RepID=UPI00406C5D2A
MTPVLPRGYRLVVAVLAGTSVLLFAVVEAAGVPLLTDPLPTLRAAGALAAVLGVALLVADVAVPVPASLVMLAHGALFGLLPGAALSLLGGVGATAVGFAVGRRARGLVDRVTTPAQRQRADRLLARWGALAILVTRPVPVLAETVAVLAGTSPLRWPAAVLAATAGTAVPAVLYAAAGAAAADAVDGVLVSVLGAGLAATLGLTGHLRSRRARCPHT